MVFLPTDGTSQHSVESLFFKIQEDFFVRKILPTGHTTLIKKRPRFYAFCFGLIMKGVGFLDFLFLLAPLAVIDDDDLSACDYA